VTAGIRRAGPVERVDYADDRPGLDLRQRRLEVHDRRERDVRVQWAGRRGRVDAAVRQGRAARRIVSNNTPWSSGRRRASARSASAVSVPPAMTSWRRVRRPCCRRDCWEPKPGYSGSESRESSSRARRCSRWSVVFHPGGEDGQGAGAGGRRRRFRLEVRLARSQHRLNIERHGSPPHRAGFRAQHSRG
jgi:hypothetical protein